MVNQELILRIVLNIPWNCKISAGLNSQTQVTSKRNCYNLCRPEVSGLHKLSAHLKMGL